MLHRNALMVTGNSYSQSKTGKPFVVHKLYGFLGYIYLKMRVKVILS